MFCGPLLAHRHLLKALFCACWILSVDVAAIEVGVAKTDITPTHPVILAGYGGRVDEHEGVASRIWARALAIGKTAPVLLLAVENCGFRISVTREIVDRLKKRTDMDADRLVVCFTHTHSAPSLTGYAPVLWGGRATGEQLARADRYTRWLVDRLVEVALKALDAREPATLAWGQGRVTFGGNRRILRGTGWGGFGFQVDGPVDHSLPLLVARGRSGRPLALWTNYACHCTTVGARNRIGGDWAGFASDAIEADFPGAVALVTIGCGADVGPQPSGTLEIAKRHGTAIAAAVKRVAGGTLTPLREVPTVETRELDLPFDTLPDRGTFEARKGQENFDGEHARRMLSIIDRDGALPRHLKFPVTTWAFGDELAIVFLAGEVVVDYAVRLKRELDWSRLWINAWSDDVPCYIPSRRVLREGGYETDFSMVYYELPTRFAPEVEDIVVAAVKGMVTERFLPHPDRGPSPYHAHPMLDPRELGKSPTLTKGERAALETRSKAIIQTIRRGETAIAPASLKRCVDRAQNGFAKLARNDGSTDSWFDFTGTKRFRPYVRQLRRGDALSWTTPPAKDASGETRTFVFGGGLGWSSQPKTEGFELLVDEEAVLRFDVTREPSRWAGENKKVELLYIPTWTSDLDSGGFFFVTLPASRVEAGKPVKLGVRSRGEKSMRWFAVDYYFDAVALARETLRM